MIKVYFERNFSIFSNFIACKPKLDFLNRIRWYISIRLSYTRKYLLISILKLQMSNRILNIAIRIILNFKIFNILLPNE